MACVCIQVYLPFVLTSIVMYLVDKTTFFCCWETNKPGGATVHHDTSKQWCWQIGKLASYQHCTVHAIQVLPQITLVHACVHTKHSVKIWKFPVLWDDLKIIITPGLGIIKLKNVFRLTVIYSSKLLTIIGFYQLNNWFIQPSITQQWIRLQNWFQHHFIPRHAFLPTTSSYLYSPLCSVN